MRMEEYEEIKTVAEIIEAMGLKKGDTIKFTLPQFKRTDGKVITYLPTAEEEYQAMSKRAAKIVGKKYFVAGLFTDFFLPLGWLGALLQKWLDEFYCSLAVRYWVQGIIKRISPRRMFSKKWTKKNGWKYIGNLADIESRRS